MPDYSYTDVENANSILQEKLITPSTLETIDTAFYNFLNDRLALSTDTLTGFRKVPVIWVSAERAHQIKNNPELRDDRGELIYPLMTIYRQSVQKDPTFKGSFQANFFDQPAPNSFPRRVNYPMARRINQVKTSEFANADSARKRGPNKNLGSGNPNRRRPKNKKVVYQTYYAPLPTYVKSTYNLKIRTDYLQQMNDLTTPFFTRTGQINTFFIEAEGHRYETFIDGNFSNNSNVDNLNGQLRIFETDITFNVLGYLMGEGPNDEKPKFSIVENAVEVKIPRERVIVGDINEFTDTSFFRE